MSTSQNPEATQYRASAAEARAAMPASSAVLRDTTRCPACFTPLSASTCQRCSLDLTHPDAASLAEVSLMAADLIDRRIGIIHRMRVDAVPATPRQQVQPATTLPASAAEPGPAPHAAPAAEQAPGALPLLPQSPVEFPRDSSAEGQPARRSGVQVALLITGISLLSVFAIFFMVYAFINYGLVWRSLIIGAVTVAAFVGASILRRRSLVASSEAVAVFALVLVYLDAFAMRANGLLSLDQVDARAYWGVVLLASGIGFIAWYRSALVRTAHLVGYGAIPTGAGLLVASATDGLDGPLAVYLVSIAITLAGTTQHTAWLSPRGHERRPAMPERIIVTVASAPAIIVAAIASTALWPESPFGSALGLLGCTAVAALQVWLHSKSAEPHDRVMAATWGAIGGLLASLTAAAYGLRTVDDLVDFPLLTVSAPLLVIALLVLWIRRGATGPLHLPLTSAAFATASVVGIAAVLAAVAALSTLVMHLGGALSGMHREPFSSTGAWSLAQWDAWLVLALVVAAGAAAAQLLGALGRYTPILAIAGVAVVLSAPPLLPTPALAIISWSVLGAAGLAMRIARASVAAAAVGTAAIGGLAFAWIAGWAADATWPFTSALVVAAILVARRTVSTTWARTALAVTASAVIVIAAIAAAELVTDGSSAAAPAALAAAAALAVLSAVPAIGLVDAERRAVLWSGLATALLALIGILSTWHLGLDLPELTVAGAGVLTCALAAWAFGRHAPLEKATSALLIAPIAGVALSTAALTWLDGPSAPLLAPALVAAIVAGIALLLSTRADESDGGDAARPPTRWALDAGAAIALVVPFGSAVTGELPNGWLAVALASVTIALVATSADGLTGSQNPRRHLGWGALVLAIGALWWALDSGGVTQPEPYVLPAAVALVVIAALLRRRETDPGAVNTQPSAWVLLLGLLFAVIPLTLASGGAGGEAAARGIATFVASAILLLAAAVVIARGVAGDRRSTTRLAGAAAVAGLLGVVGVTVLRSARAISTGTVVELWLAPGLLVLGAAAVILCHRGIGSSIAGSDKQRHEPRIVAEADMAGAWAFRGAVALATVIEVAAVMNDTEPVARLSIVVGALASLHVISHLWVTLPLGVTTGWFAFVLASGTALVGVVWAEHIEQLTLPLALALLVTGGTALWRDSSARSWARLGPAVSLLLVPSLVATFVEPEVWRLVGLGAVGVVTLIAGVILRLQAPFIVGTVVVLVHALHTFAPQLRIVYEAADWYIWAGIGGALIMAIAIRYEQRMRDLKRVATSIAALR